MYMKFNTKIKILQISNLLFLIYGMYYIFLTEYYFYLGIAFVFFLIFGIIGANIGLHRYFSHKSFKTSKPIEYLLAFVGTLTTLGSIINWVGVHRYHHINADTNLDPHSPKYIGLIKAYTFQWKDSTISKKIIKDLFSNPIISFTHRNYFKIILLYILILFLIDPMLPIFAYCIPATLCLNGVAAVTVICHIHGYRNFETNDFARNSWIASILSLGEGWHNNHHYNSYNYRQGIKWWEVDPSASIIKMIKK
jgi:fatty-acid desaturase